MNFTKSPILLVLTFVLTSCGGLDNNGSTNLQTKPLAEAEEAKLFAQLEKDPDYQSFLKESEAEFIAENPEMREILDILGMDSIWDLEVDKEYQVNFVTKTFQVIDERALTAQQGVGLFEASSELRQQNIPGFREVIGDSETSGGCIGVPPNTIPDLSILAAMRGPGGRTNSDNDNRRTNRLTVFTSLPIFLGTYALNATHLASCAGSTAATKRTTDSLTVF